MKALELSGVHVKSMIHATWHTYNKNGTLRKGARAHEWWVMPTTIMHREDGSVRITGKWFTSPPHTRNARNYETKTNYKTWYLYGSVSSHPDAFPHYADVDIVELPT